MPSHLQRQLNNENNAEDPFVQSTVESDALDSQRLDGSSQTDRITTLKKASGRNTVAGARTRVKNARTKRAPSKPRTARHSQTPAVGGATDDAVNSNSRDWGG